MQISCRKFCADWVLFRMSSSLWDKDDTEHKDDTEPIFCVRNVPDSLEIPAHYITEDHKYDEKSAWANLEEILISLRIVNIFVPEQDEEYFDHRGIPVSRRSKFKWMPTFHIGHERMKKVVSVPSVDGFSWLIRRSLRNRIDELAERIEALEKLTGAQPAPTENETDTKEGTENEAEADSQMADF